MGVVRKPFLALRGEPVLLHALRPFLAHPAVVAVRVALAAEDAADAPAWLRDLDPRVRVVAGGGTRAESVRAALDALGDVDVVLVHDAARPLVTAAAIQRCIDAAARGEGAVAGWPASDTLKEVDEDRFVRATPDRSRIWHAQTPQAFPAELLRRAYAAWDGIEATDDAALVERVGGRVRMVEGSATNIKVTRPEDVAIVEAILAMGAPVPEAQASSGR
ncbi:MAG: 2-C-methyl-D-erythritol 4-phosphate cytidylyltransferase [Gemmatimonadetes bacterium]|nr:2-C-methyl-D-erythritol 4-phosphate cytidylyltransferase [Gemmatimonadota bacterium]